MVHDDQIRRIILFFIIPALQQPKLLPLHLLAQVELSQHLPLLISQSLVVFQDPTRVNSRPGHSLLHLLILQRHRVPRERLIRHRLYLTVMSSLISDIFYGSKQAILEQELLHQHFLEREESIPNAVALEFIFSTAHRVKIQIGKHWDEAVASARHPTVTLMIESLTLEQLSTFTNFKVTLSLNENRAFGFIPMQIVLQVVKGNSTKNISIPLKGNWEVSRIPCRIRVVGQGNILNSQIFGNSASDAKKDSFEMGNHRQVSKYESQPSHESSSKEPIQPNHRRVFKKPSQSISISSKPHEFTREVNISFRISKLKLFTIKTVAPLSIQSNQSKYHVGDTLSITTLQGFKLCVCAETQLIGFIHLNSALILQGTISGQFPIIAQQGEACIGIAQLSNRQAPIIDEKPLPEITMCKKVALNGIFVLSFSSIILLKYDSQLDEEKNEPRKEMDLRKACDLHMLVRIGKEVLKVTQMRLRLFEDNPYLYELELDRKSKDDCPCVVHIWEQHLPSQVDVQLYCNHQLISYSKMSILADNKSHFGECLLTGNGDYTLMTSLYAKFALLTYKQNSFKPEKIKHISAVLEHLLTNRSYVLAQGEAFVKQITSGHKKVTSIEARKLVELLNAEEIIEVQHMRLTKLRCPPALIEMYQTLLREFMYIDPTRSWCVPKQQFQQILSFYQHQLGETHGTVIISKGAHPWEDKQLNSSQAVSYLHFLAGFLMSRDHVAIDQAKASMPQIEVIPVPAVGEVIEVETVKDEPRWRATQQVLILKMECENMHVLNNSRIPNVVSNLSKKVHYSCANPTIVLNRLVDISEPLKIYHKSLADQRLIFLHQVVLFRHKKNYDLGDGAKITVHWGEG